MTTETAPRGHAHRPGSARPLVGAAALCLLVGALLTALAAASGGASAWQAAATGTLITVGVLLSGALAVDLVAALVPALSLLVALLTYTLQLVVLALVFWAIRDSSTFAADAARAWLAGAVVVVTLTWTTAHLVLATRARIPVFDARSGREGQGR